MAPDVQRMWKHPKIYNFSFANSNPSLPPTPTSGAVYAT